MHHESFLPHSMESDAKRDINRFEILMDCIKGCEKQRVPGIERKGMQKHEHNEKQQHQKSVEEEYKSSKIHTRDGNEMLVCMCVCVPDASKKDTHEQIIRLFMPNTNPRS